LHCWNNRSPTAGFSTPLRYENAPNLFPPNNAFRTRRF
jgi:hypothetical protein